MLQIPGGRKLGPGSEWAGGGVVGEMAGEELCWGWGGRGRGGKGG